MPIFSGSGTNLWVEAWLMSQSSCRCQSDAETTVNVKLCLLFLCMFVRAKKPLEIHIFFFLFQVCRKYLFVELKMQTFRELVLRNRYFTLFLIMTYNFSLNFCKYIVNVKECFSVMVIFNGCGLFFHILYVSWKVSFSCFVNFSPCSQLLCHSETFVF